MKINKDHPRGIGVPGCPPSSKRIYETLMKELAAPPEIGK
jgi:coenzyme F420-reducing hydrogenase gamma subunit